MKIKLGLLLTLMSASAAFANIQSFVTPAGSSTGGGPVSASALVVTGAGTVTITLTDLQANPTDVAQLISDFDFVLSNGVKTGTLASQTGSRINIDGSGNATSASGNPTGWELNTLGAGLQLDALGGGQPKDLIIGPAGLGGVYTNANGSIAGNGPHNPFINQTGTFVVDVTGVTVDTTITSVAFSFGTTEGQFVIPGVPGSAVPEPTSVLLLGSALGVLLVGLRKRPPSR
jgi:hypothetical protein